MIGFFVLYKILVILLTVRKRSLYLRSSGSTPLSPTKLTGSLNGKSTCLINMRERDRYPCRQQKYKRVSYNGITLAFQA